MFYDQNGPSADVGSALLSGIGAVAGGISSAISTVTLGKAMFLVWVPSMANKVYGIPFPIPVQFRPNSLSFQTSSEWESAISWQISEPGDDGKTSREKKDAGYMEFKGSSNGEFEVELFYDTTAWEAPVKVWVEPIVALAYPIGTNPYVKAVKKAFLTATDDDKRSSPLVRFMYGSHISALSYVGGIEVDYSHFHPNGFAQRATVKVTLNPYSGDPEKAKQNPTSQTDPRRTYVVGYGETLDFIAAKEFGNPEYWRHIAETNNIANPRHLRSGQLLNIVPLD